MQPRITIHFFNNRAKAFGAILFLLLSPFFSSVLFAQTAPVQSQFFTLKGDVLDSLSGAPLAGVSLALHGKQDMTAISTIISGEDGSFQIKTPLSTPRYLVVTSVGYSAKKIVLSVAASD